MTGWEPVIAGPEGITLKPLACSPDVENLVGGKGGVYARLFLQETVTLLVVLN